MVNLFPSFILVHSDSCSFLYFFFSSLQLEVSEVARSTSFCFTASVSETSDFVVGYWRLPEKLFTYRMYLLRENSCWRSISFFNTLSLENALSIVGSRSHGGGLAE